MASASHLRLLQLHQICRHIRIAAPVQAAAQVRLPASQSTRHAALVTDLQRHNTHIITHTCIVCEL